MWINTARNAGRINRFHTKPLLFDQDIAQHSFNSLFIMLELAKNADNIDENKLMKYICLHDLGESASGDCVGSSKAEYPELKKALDRVEKDWYDRNLPEYLKSAFDLNEKEKLVAKISDLLEGLITALTDVSLGNKTLESAVRDIYNTLMNKWVDAETMYDDLEENVGRIVYWIDNEFDEELEKCLREG